MPGDPGNGLHLAQARIVVGGTDKARTFSMPRRRNWRKPSVCLFCRNIGRQLRGFAAGIGLGRIGDWRQLSMIAAGLRHVMSDDDPHFGVDSDLGAIRLTTCVQGARPAYGSGFVSPSDLATKVSIPTRGVRSRDFDAVICVSGQNFMPHRTST